MSIKYAYIVYTIYGMRLSYNNGNQFNNTTIRRQNTDSYCYLTSLYGTVHRLTGVVRDVPPRLVYLFSEQSDAPTFALRRESRRFVNEGLEEN